MSPIFKLQPNIVTSAANENKITLNTTKSKVLPDMFK